MYVIYGLEDPRDNQVFYVGMTSDMYARFIQHIRCEENNAIKNERIHGLKAMGCLPTPRTLETTHTMQQAREREQYWISHYFYLGMPLTNEIRPAMQRRIKGSLGERALVIVDARADTINIVTEELARRVMLLQAEGIQKPDIMRQVWGVNPGGSEDYKRAIAQYQEVMKFIAERLGA